jgi:hypothetical protein
MAKRSERFHRYRSGILDSAQRGFCWIKRHRDWTTTFDLLIINILATCPFFACEAGWISPPEAVSIFAVSQFAYGSWFGALNGSNAYLGTMLRAVVAGLSVPQVVEFLGKPYPHEEFRLFAVQMVPICMFLTSTDTCSPGFSITW